MSQLSNAVLKLKGAPLTAQVPSLWFGPISIESSGHIYARTPRDKPPFRVAVTSRRAALTTTPETTLVAKSRTR